MFILRTQIGQDGVRREEECRHQEEERLIEREGQEAEAKGMTVYRKC